jgi:hypothetical protein
MDAATRDLVRTRAGNACEYCRLPQAALPAVTFPIEHITAKQHGGSDDASNLALSGHHGSLHKGPNLTGIDPQTGRIVRLFHPRSHVWTERFTMQGLAVVGVTPLGRATVRVLAMNSAAQIQTRSTLP